MKRAATVAFAVIAVLVASGPAGARPTDVSVVTSVGSYPAAPAIIGAFSAGSATTAFSVSTSSFPAGYDFVVTHASARLSATAAITPDYGQFSGDHYVYVMPTTADYKTWVWNGPLSLRLRQYGYFDIGWSPTTSIQLYVRWMGYWINETTGQLVAPPAGFKSGDPVDKRRG